MAVAKEHHSPLTSRQIVGARHLQRDVAELPIAVDAESDIVAGLERRDLPLQPLRLRAGKPSVARVFARDAEVHPANRGNAIPFLETGLRRWRGIHHAHDEHAERIATAAGVANAETQRRPIPHVSARRTHELATAKQRVRVCRLDLHRLGSAVAIDAQLDLIARFRLPEFTLEAAGQRTGHLAVLHVRRIRAEAHSVDRREAVPFLESGLLRWAALCDGGDHDAEGVA